jgi:hypothetical protein
MFTEEEKTLLNPPGPNGRGKQEAVKLLEMGI